jgi:hypothetical protein
LHVCGVLQLKLSEEEPIGFEGGEGCHGRDESTEGGGLTIPSGGSLPIPHRDAGRANVPYTDAPQVFDGKAVDATADNT